MDPRSPSFGVLRSPLPAPVLRNEEVEVEDNDVLRDITTEVEHQTRKENQHVMACGDEDKENAHGQEREEKRVDDYEDAEDADDVFLMMPSTPIADAKAFLSSPALWRAMQEASPAMFKSPDSAARSEPILRPMQSPAHRRLLFRTESDLAQAV